MLNFLLALFSPPQDNWECGDPFPNGCTELHNFEPEPFQRPLQNVPGYPSTGWKPPKGLEGHIDHARGVPTSPVFYFSVPLFNFWKGK